MSSTATGAEARRKAKAIQAKAQEALHEDMVSVGVTTSKPAMEIFYLATALHPERTVIKGIHTYFEGLSQVRIAEEQSVAPRGTRNEQQTSVGVLKMSAFGKDKMSKGDAYVCTTSHRTQSFAHPAGVR